MPGLHDDLTLAALEPFRQVLVRDDVTAGGNIQCAAGGIDGLLLRADGLIEHRQAGDIVLHFAESVENGIAIRCHTGVVTRFGKLSLRASSTSGKDAFRDIRPDSPEGALHIQEFGDVRRLPSAIGKEIQRRVVSRARNPNLCVGHSHLAFGFGDVRAALQEIRGQSGIQRRGLRV